MATLELIDSLKKAIQAEDERLFRISYQKLVDLCRKFLFEGEKEKMEQIYPLLSSLLNYFYRSGQPAWVKVDHKMGGLEMLRSLISNLKDTRTTQEALIEIRGTADEALLSELTKHRDGCLSGELAKKLGKSPNALTNRLPKLEKKGLIVRAKRGKNSLVFLTPKGQSLIGGLVVPQSQPKVVPQEVGEYLDTCGRKHNSSDAFFFWRKTESAASGAA
ncbi:MAG: hypothetical protein COB67_02275 [SAR324 cluster bacterium]|uniref:HTH marR-type domain-containing protein n=1 Tax=SAR324 cluster bacterium TaxID=2024889 RepID=A0A2A4TAD9_9DELT|nr:MAG: hypothetical protein COB67_02275 [SAR324 cluster bacterium]